MLTIPCSILSRLQKICANNNRNYESAPFDEINRRSLTEDEFGRTYIISFIIGGYVAFQQGF